MRKAISRSPFHVLRFILAAVFLSCVVLAFGQEPKRAPAAEPTKAQATQQPEQKPAAKPGINEQFGKPLAEESREAARGGGEKEDAQEKMVEELKHSKSVQWLANTLHVSPSAGYWIGILLDFAILAAIIIWAMKKNLPAAFRSRTATIQRGIEEARKASAEANTRLADIEVRLAKLSDDVAAMRATAEGEAQAEEQRILAAAEEDKNRMVQAAESEIAASAKEARRELKAFAAELAVTLAERRIHVDQATDQALVRSFTEELGNSAGKDGK